jgi:hypothetical protein
MNNGDLTVKDARAVGTQARTALLALPMIIELVNKNIFK